jgi:CRP-like cAMP-binding protein
MDVKHLDRLPLFATLSKKQREVIAQHADEVDLGPGKELVHEGAIAWEFFVIESGEAEVRHGTEAVAKLGPGDFFGEIGVLAKDARRTASVVTTSSMRAIVMAAHELRVIANEMPEVAERLRAAIAERTKQLT